MNGATERFKKIARPLPAVAAALLLARFLFVCAALARALPEGPLPVVRFGLAAAAVCFGPGLALWRFSRLPLAISEMAVFVPACGLATTGTAAWALYACGAWTRPAAHALLALFAAAGAWGSAPLLSRRVLRTVALRAVALPPAAWFGTLFVALFAEGVFEAAAGTPFTAWDAVVSWGKWAADMGAREGVGAQLLGGYPQLLPALHSFFFKLAGTPADAVLPAEELLLHGFDAIFPALLGLSLLVLGKRHSFSAPLALAILAACDPFHADLAAGQADIPLAAFVAVLAALLPALTARRGVRSAIPLALLFYTVLFAKGSGVVFALTLLVYVGCLDGRPAARQAAAAFAIAFVPTLFYVLRQAWLSAHPAACESSPFLLALPFHSTHARLFSADLPHLAEMLRRLVACRAHPDASPVAFAVLGAGLGAALVRRRTRGAALAVAVLLALWFFLASYDWRNAYPALALGAAVLAAAAFPASPVSFRRAFARNLPGGLLPVLLWCALAATAAVGMVRNGAAAEFAAPILRRWNAPKAARLPPGQRPMALRHQGPLRNLLFAAPWASRAEHIWAGDPLYRILAPKGCYSIQANAWKEARPGDLFVATAAQSRPSTRGFVPIARLRRMPGYRSIWMFRPDRVPGSVLEVPAPPDAASDRRERFGATAEGDPLAAYLAPFRDGAVLRLPNPACGQGAGGLRRE